VRTGHEEKATNLPVSKKVGVKELLEEVTHAVMKKVSYAARASFCVDVDSRLMS
jgi:hypothetical protein